MWAAAANSLPGATGSLPASGRLPWCDYRYAALTDLRLPRSLDWLGPAEQQAAAGFRAAGRRRAWLAGRLLAKRLIAARLAAIEPGEVRGCAQIEISSAGRRPGIVAGGRPLGWSLSIAHSDRAVLVGLSCVAGISIGVDLAELKPYGRGFTELWFSPAELECLPPGMLWAVKEATYKASNSERSFDPRTIEIRAGEQGHYTARLRRESGDRECQLAAWQTPQHEIAVLAVYTRSEAGAWKRAQSTIVNDPTAGKVSPLPEMVIR